MSRTDIQGVDVLVVGAGPAGAAAAHATARAGLKTLVLERRTTIGHPVRCAEYVPAALIREVPVQAWIVAQAAASLVLHFPGGESRELHSPGVILDRARFEQALVDAAVEAGATLWLGSPLQKLHRGQLAQVGGRHAGAMVQARLVIGADGPRSRVAEAVGLGRPRFMIGLQRALPLQVSVAAAQLYFDAACRHGYGWLFPKGETANVGVALPRGQGAEARQALAALVHRLVQEEVVVPSVAQGPGGGNGDPGRGGLIPCSGPLPRIAAGRVLLVGDAAGQTDALTGGGIVAALRAGSLAGTTAAAFLPGRPGREAAAAYEGQWRTTYGRAAARALSRRFELEAFWDRDLEKALRLAWLPGA